MVRDEGYPMTEILYTSGDYLEKNPDWHTEESPWKAAQVLRMLAQHQLAVTTFGEVGCGAGEILKQLQAKLDPNCIFWGYDISPQAFELAKSRTNERLHFRLADLRQEEGVFFDLLLVMDVLEHLEDYFSFLREIKPKSRYKILHIPLDLSAQTILRGGGLLKVRDAYGHLHYFTKETALEMLKDAGYEVIDHFYTARAVEMPTHELKRTLLKLPRRALFAIHPDFAARMLGGWSLLVLAQ